MLARCVRWAGWTAVLGLVWGPAAIATPLDQAGVQRVMLVVLENADYDTARAQPEVPHLLPLQLGQAPRFSTVWRAQSRSGRHAPEPCRRTLDDVPQANLVGVLQGLVEGDDALALSVGVSSIGTVFGEPGDGMTRDAPRRCGETRDGMLADDDQRWADSVGRVGAKSLRVRFGPELG